MKIITSVQNDTIKELIKLHDAKGRKEQRACLIEGIRAIETFLKSGTTLYQLYATETEQYSALSIVSSEHITLVSQSVMTKLSQAVSPSGLVAHVTLPQKPNAAELTAGIVLAQIQDPGNMGTLIRTAAALGVTSVVVVEGCDPWSHKVIQASAGTLAQVRLFELSWDELIAAKKDLQICALTPREGARISSLTANKSLLVVGNEARGLPDSWIAQCDTLITLPMPGNTESLNAAIAGSIALYALYQPNF